MFKKNNKKNLIVIPPYYQGTSFQDIVEGLILSAKKISIPIEFLGDKKPLSNNLFPGFLDDEKYIRGQYKIYGKLINEKYLDKILFLDFFNPGIDLLRYFHEQQGMKVKYGSLLHGGTFLSDDLYSFSWLAKFEQAWFDIYDSIYVPSKFLANSCRQFKKNNLKIFPWGMDAYNNIKITYKKKWDVIFPHRLDSDKGAGEFIKIVSLLPDISFIVTVPQPKHILEKNKYYKVLKNYKNVTFVAGNFGKRHLDILSKSRILLSCSKQETFGYSVMKGVLAGCIPVLPNGLSYPEFFGNKFLYSNLEQCTNLIKKYIKLQKSLKISTEIATLREKIKSFSFLAILRDFFKK